MYFYSLFILSSALHLIAERLASVTADTSFKVFGLTRPRMEPSLPASKANALNHCRKQKLVSCIFILPSRESDIKALYELAYELLAICLPHQDGGIPLSAFPNGTTSKLARLFSTLSLQCWASSREAVNTNVKVIGLTRLGIKPQSTAQETDALYH